MSNQRTLTTTLNTVLRQLKENPLNWALLAMLAYLLRAYTTSGKPKIEEAKHPEVLVFKNYTPIELLPFNGLGKDGRILMAVNGSIYDVSRGRNFYGPGMCGPYANFAGRDASRGLAKNSFDLDMLTDPNEAIDKLEDLSADEWESLREWEQHFASKYLLVGKLVENHQ
ncbi:cytochrome b5 [Rhizopus microsporus ATCC 52813]|uniref:Cytochrome b5 n=1 Tax=Rhizopus microsporus ATCC 52813 TaxID=1340429 RepID=A0A2G4T3P6_RHIZD|nr:cytochrome b5 [Rhizopus microsporus ATCC 52813]PHZ15625.1 cytochrome b5 [Rhizopus microsporus ATCC 52813]